ncbi:MAG: sensor histidine kinase [Bacillota bacterium]
MGNVSPLDPRIRSLKVNWLRLALRDVVLAACFLAALRLEAPARERLAVLALLFAVFTLWVHLKELGPIRCHRLYYLAFLADIALVYLIEQNSRFVINYYFHLIYFLLIISAQTDLPRKHGLAVSVLTFLVSMIKFAELLRINPGPANISLAIFSFFTGVLTIVILNYARYIREDKETIARLYDELKAYAGQVQELAVTAERNRIAREIHDSLGHSLTALIMELEIYQRTLARDPAQAQKMLEEIKAGARKGLAAVRQAVEALRPRELEEGSLPEALGELVREFASGTGVTIKLAKKNRIPPLPPLSGLALYRAAQEALTNAVRHGRAAQVDIILERTAAGVVLTVADNGQGAAEIRPGYGLAGMAERVEAAGGRVEFISEKGKGFTVKVEIPFSSFNDLVNFPSCSNGPAGPY